MSREKLANYLNDHLGGSTVALDLLGHLAETQPADRNYYAGLRREIQDDQDMLKKLLEGLQEKKSLAMQGAGWMAEKLGRLKMRLEGMEHHELGLFESLEILALGIHGKKLLWAALAKVAHGYPAWADIDFAALKKNADRQYRSVEQRRLSLSLKILGAS